MELTTAEGDVLRAVAAHPGRVPVGPPDRGRGTFHTVDRNAACALEIIGLLCRILMREPATPGSHHPDRSVWAMTEAGRTAYLELMQGELAEEAVRTATESGDRLSTETARTVTAQVLARVGYHIPAPVPQG